MMVTNRYYIDVRCYFSSDKILKGKKTNLQLIFVGFILYSQIYDLNSFTRQRGELPHNASIPCNLQFTSNDRQNRIVLFIFWGTKHHTVLCNILTILAFKNWKPFIICWFSSLQIPVHPNTTKHGISWEAEVGIYGKDLKKYSFHVLFSDIRCFMNGQQAWWRWRRKRGRKFDHRDGTTSVFTISFCICYL